MVILKSFIAFIHIAFFLFISYAFFFEGYVMNRIIIFLTTDGTGMSNFSRNLHAVGFFYSPIALLFSTYLLFKKIEILQKPLLILNTLVIFIYVQLTFNFIKATLEFDLSLDVPILFIYMILVCSFISLRLFKQK
tara:strand:+ start:132 stop:536 length:405 start_codon:yes stop_codon:yes gene_type:complete